MESIQLREEETLQQIPFWKTFVRPHSSRLLEKFKPAYMHLVAEHLSPAQRTAAGLRALPGENKPTSSTQAAWRFYNDPKLTLQQVFSPLLQDVLGLIPQACSRYLLVACDWSNLHYKGHHSKKHRVALAHSKDLGYEMFSGLALSDRTGQPIGPLWIDLRDEVGVHSTRLHQVSPTVSVLDGIIDNMNFVTQLGIAQRPVFIIDAECDSIAHLRQWHAEDKTFVVRGRATHTAIHEGSRCSLQEIGDLLHQRGEFVQTGTVRFEGENLQQWVTETNITITRAARPERNGEKRRSIKGAPLTLRLVLSQLRNDSGKVISTWHLQTNAASDVESTTIVQWYGWRWKIEDYHKLLKSAGQEVESWQQESCEAIARRLAVASMACLIVWSLQRDTSEEAGAMRALLVRLSGRQMSKNRPATAPALLAGLWILLAYDDALREYDLETLRSFAAKSRAIIASKFM